MSFSQSARLSCSARSKGSCAAQGQRGRAAAGSTRKLLGISVNTYKSYG